MRDFVAAGKSAKPPFSYASFGTGSSFHIYGEMLAKAMRMEMIHVPYKGEAAATSDLLGGQVTSSFASVGTALPFIKAGTLRALGIVFPRHRSKVLPDVPTFAELSVRSPDVGGWFGVLAPAGTPTTIVQKVSADIREILEQPDVIANLREQGLVPEPARRKRSAFVFTKTWGVEGTPARARHTTWRLKANRPNSRTRAGAKAVPRPFLRRQPNLDRPLSRRIPVAEIQS